MCHVESQDICLVETHDMCCVESWDMCFVQSQHKGSPQPPRAAAAVARCFFSTFQRPLSAATSSFDSTASQGRQSYRPMFFFRFFRDLSANASSFESISGRQSSQTVLKSMCLIGEVLEQVKKHCARVRSEQLLR